MLNKPTKIYFPQLTGLRAITAYFVFAQHFNPFSGSMSFLYKLFNEMDFTLVVFFVLSGFVITYRYLDKIPFNSFSFKEYLIGRVARICPLYFIITLITFIYYTFYNKSIDLNTNQFFILVSNLIFIKSFFNNLKFTLVAQGWTLTVEWCFYIFAPLIILLVKRSYIYIFVIAITLGIFGFSLVKISQYFHLSYGFFSDKIFMLVYTFFGRCFDFLCGVALAVFLHRNKNIRKNNSNSILWLTWAGFIGCICLILVLISFQSIGNPIGLLTKKGILVNHPLTPIFITILIYGLIIEKTFVARLLSSKLMQILGKSSYAFYLIHLGLLSSFIKLKVVHNNFILHFIIINIISIIVYEYVEKPLYKKVKSISQKFLFKPKVTPNYILEESVKK